MTRDGRIFAYLSAGEVLAYDTQRASLALWGTSGSTANLRRAGQGVLHAAARRCDLGDPAPWRGCRPTADELVVFDATVNRRPSPRSSLRRSDGPDRLPVERSGVHASIDGGGRSSECALPLSHEDSARGARRRPNHGQSDRSAPSDWAHARLLHKQIGNAVRDLTML